MRLGVSPVSAVFLDIRNCIIDSILGILSGILDLFNCFINYLLGFRFVSDDNNLDNSFFLSSGGDHIGEIIPSSEFPVDNWVSKYVHNSSKEPADSHHDEQNSCVCVASLINTGERSHLDEGEQSWEEIEDPGAVKSDVGRPHVEEPMGVVVLVFDVDHVHNPEDKFWYGNEHIEDKNPHVRKSSPAESGV